MASWMSPLASDITLPISWVSSLASSSLRSSRMRAALNSTCARLGGGVSLQVGKADHADSTARFTSSLDATCNVANFSSVAGFVFSNVSLVDESVHSPFMSNLYSCIMIPRLKHCKL